MRTFTCVARPVGGDCGINHRSIEAAAKCCHRRSESARREWPNSICSNFVEVSEPGDGPEDLTEEERDQVRAIWADLDS